MLGRSLGRYRILEEVGAGGMGVVYRAHDERLDRDVALKVLTEWRVGDEKSRKRLREEAKSLSKLNHPNIATVHDFDTSDDVDYLVMELISGTSVEDMLASGPLEEEDAVRLALQLAEGLARGSRARCDPPRLEAGESPSHGRWTFEDSGLRSRFAAEADERLGDDGIGIDRCPGGRRHDALYGAGTVKFTPGKAGGLSSVSPSKGPKLAPPKGGLSC